MYVVTCIHLHTFIHFHMQSEIYIFINNYIDTQLYLVIYLIYLYIHTYIHT